MTHNPALRRWLSLAGTGAVFAIVLGVLAFQKSPGPSVGRASADEEKAARDRADVKDMAARSWPMWGGSLQRNPVNLKETGIATNWSTATGKEKNIKWSVNLGSKAYGGPIVSGGKIFIGTNNNFPRNKEIRGDKGVLMCFRESDGSFLWQSVNDKLTAGRVNDWPEEGICSSPVVEGNRIYFVSNRCEVVCATTEGLKGGNVGPVKDEKYKSDTDADIVWKLDMIGQ